MLTPHVLATLYLQVEAPLHQFETDTTISAWCTYIPKPTSKSVMLLKRGVMVWASRADLAPLLFPDPPTPENTDVLAALRSQATPDTDAMPEDRAREDRLRPA